MDHSHFESLYPDNARESEVARIMELIKKGSSCQVIGLPGVGRSNLLKLLSYNRNVRIKHLGENQKWFHFVYMDFSEVRKKPLSDVIKFILISLSYSLSERKMEAEHKAVEQFLKNALTVADEMILFHALKKAIDYLAIEKELTVVLLMDRFDQYTPEITADFFLDLKILRNRAKYRFSALFAMNRPLEELIEPLIYAEFYEFLVDNIIYLSLSDFVITEFRFAYLEKVTGKKGSEKVKKEILTLTGGHGKLSGLAYETVLSETDPIKDLKAFLLNKNSIKGALFGIWSSLTPHEQRLLKNISTHHTTVYEEEELKFIQNVFLFEKGKITIHLFEEFINMLPESRDENIRYDVEKNEILKGTESITEQLSPSEFRLLRFLIQHAGAVCEKEEIISAVWREAKTQEGVTDQALDQIVYRLRKKIEQDPNNPTRIHTVKGRGYRFTS